MKAGRRDATRAHLLLCSRPSSSGPLAIRLLLLTGARRDEVLTLRWSQVDFERSALRLPDSKTGAKVIPLGPTALDLLATAPRLDEGNPFVVPGRRVGGRLVGIHRPWVRIREKAGIGDVRLHDLRHSFASVGAAAGLGLPVLGAILGHNHPATSRMATRSRWRSGNWWSKGDSNSEKPVRQTFEEAPSSTPWRPQPKRRPSFRR